MKRLKLCAINAVVCRDLALIDLLASTGMRVGELVRLNKVDIDLKQGMYSFRERKQRTAGIF